MFDTSLAIPESISDSWLAAVPAAPAVFALFGREPGDEPYIAKTANLRQRMRRLLAPEFSGTRRLHLAGRVARLDYSPAGSRFATSLLLVEATRRLCGARANQRLRLRPPALLRLAVENAYPRAYVTNKLTQRSLAVTYGPFPSRLAAERFLDDSLNFFDLRRCTQELVPDPAFPGCVYSEMKMCLAPCFQGCTEERYAHEVDRVREYLATRGRQTIARIEQERDAASAALDFELAGRLHQRMQKMKAVAEQAAPLVHPVSELDAVILQPAAHFSRPQAPQPTGSEKMSNRTLLSESQHVAVFLVRAGQILGPAFYSVEGMRHPNERAGSTSLFAHPAMLEPTPLEPAPDPAAEKSSRNQLEQRLLAIIEDLSAQSRKEKLPLAQVAEHLSLLARWYYRPLAQRTGEIFFREQAQGSGPGEFPISHVLRGISRVFCGQKAADTVSSGAAME